MDKKIKSSDILLSREDLESAVRFWYERQLTAFDKSKVSLVSLHPNNKYVARFHIGDVQPTETNHD